MIGNFFAPLGTKIFSGVVIALLILLGVQHLSHKAKVSDLNHRLSMKQDEVDRLTVDNATLRGNNSQLDAGLKQCNSSVDNLKAVADSVAKAGVAAVQQVQQAGQKAVAAKVKTIDAMPKETCEDAFKILKTTN